MTIQQVPTNPIPSDVVMFAAIFEITENDQNISKPWIGSPDDYLYTGICVLFQYWVMKV